MTEIGEVAQFESAAMSYGSRTKNCLAPLRSLSSCIFSLHKFSFHKFLCEHYLLVASCTMVFDMHAYSSYHTSAFGSDLEVMVLY